MIRRPHADAVGTKPRSAITLPARGITAFLKKVGTPEGIEITSGYGAFRLWDGRRLGRSSPAIGPGCVKTLKALWFI